MVEADKKYSEEEDTQQYRYLTFSLDEDIYGIEISYVTEIIGILPITKIPETPAFVKGVINLRGQIIPVMDMRLKFHKPETGYNDRTCVMVVHIGTIVIGLIVDRVVEVLTITDEDTVPPPDFCAGNKNPYIKAVDNRNSSIKLLIDSNKLLIEEELLLFENLKDKGE